MANVMNYREMDLKSVVYRIPEKRDRRNVSDMGYGNTSTPIYIQTPKLVCRKVKGEEYLELDISSDSFYNFLRSLDYRNQEIVVSESSNWFKGKQFSMDYVEDCYKSPLIPPKNSKDLFRVRLHMADDKMFFNQHKESLTVKDVEHLVNNTQEQIKVISIIHIKGLWITSTTIGVQYEVVQTKVYTPNIRKPISYALDSDDECEKKEERKESKKEEKREKEKREKREERREKEKVDVKVMEERREESVTPNELLSNEKEERVEVSEEKVDETIKLVKIDV